MSPVDYAKNIEMRGNVTSGMDRITDVPRCRFIRTVAQSFTANIAAPVQFDVPPPIATCWDTDGMFVSIGVTSTRLTCRTAGVYDVTAQHVFEASAAGAVRQAWIGKNTAGAGTGQRYGVDYRVVVAAVAGFFYLNCHAVMQLQADDYVELFAVADVGPTLSSTAGGLHPASEISATMISTI